MTEGSSDKNSTATAASSEAVAPRPSLPDRLSVNPRSRWFDESVLSHEVGIRFNGQERTNVEEYCVSEGWIRVAAGKALDRRGNPVTLMLRGKVEPYYRNPGS
jgi:hypothetical protein